MFYECIVTDTTEKKNIDFILEISENENIIREIYTHLCNEFHDDSYDNMKSGLKPIVEYLKKRYVIKTIKQVSVCWGCIENQPNQLAHIDCSNGCLHNPETCDECK